MEIWGRDNLDSCNAYHVGKICYTEDQITVYNLYVSNIPKNINEKSLQTYFEQFGEVTSVRIVQRKRVKSVFRYAFINFKNPESAARALRTSLHIIQSKRMKVKAADSWKQPKKSEKSSNDDKNADDGIENVPPNTILKLNDDCLLHIFSFLSLREKLKMSNLCERFETLFTLQFKIEKSLDLNVDKNLTLMEIREIVTKVGHLIERISYKGEYLPTNHKRFIEFLPNYCQNLKILELQSVNNIHLDTFRRISMNLKSLKQLQLINCDINDQICLHLSQLPDIDTLNLSENYELTGKCLHKFEKLRKLTLNNCANIQPLYFADICNTLKLLTELNIKRCDRLNEESYSLLSNNLSNLEILTISTNYQAEKLHTISKLQKLKSLTIHCTNLKDDLFVNLSEKSEHILEKLSIYGGHLNDKKMQAIKMIKSIKELRLPNDTEINDEFLLGLAKLKSLQYLDISGCTLITKYGIIQLLQISESIQTIDISSCFQFTDDLIFEIIDLLKIKKRYEPYKLIIGKTNISATIEEDPKFRGNKSLLELSFDYNLYYHDIDDDEDDDDDDNDLQYEDDDDDFDDIGMYGGFIDSDEDDLLFEMPTNAEDYVISRILFGSIS